MAKRIALVSHSAGGGGAERVATLVANYFDDCGYEVSFYAIHSDKHEYALNENVRYEFCGVKTKNGFLAQLSRAVRLFNYMKKNKIDVMISFVYVEGIFLVGNRSIKKIYSLRNDPTRFYNSGINKWLRNIVYRDADCVVFQTPDARDYFSKKVQKHSILIANPLKEDLPIWNVKNHSNEVIAACRINEQKNLYMLLDAYKLVWEQRKDYQLVIYGEGSLRKKLEIYADSLGLNEAVQFRGFAQNIHEIMQKSAIYVSSSDYEGISNSMLEALAIGIPSICTDCPVGGSRMFIESGRNGFLVPVGDSKTMADKLLCLMENEKLQRQFSEASQKIREELTPEKIYGAWAKLI